jgi:hypothetical protein
MNTEANIYITSASISALGYCNYLDHYIFKDPISGVNIFYPLTAYGGPLSASGGVTFDSVTSGGPMYDVCFQDYCYKTYQVGTFKLFCNTTVNFRLSGIDETDSRVIKVIYNFGDGSDMYEVDLSTINGVVYSPINTVVSRTYYPTNTLVTTYTPTISVIRNDCCINTYTLTLSTFRCGILDIYEDVVLLNAQQTAGFDIILTLEKKNDRQIFKNALNINDLEFVVPALSTLPNLVEPVPPTRNKPRVDALVPKQFDQPVQENPVIAPEIGYNYIEGEGIDLVPNYIQLVPSEDLIPLNDITSGVTISGDGPPYFAAEGIDIRYT